jgi:hypothetical protein
MVLEIPAIKQTKKNKERHPYQKEKKQYNYSYFWMT